MKTRHSKLTKGLTLLELLFACGFLVMILCITFLLFDRNIMISRKVVSSTQRQQECRAAMDSMIAELRAAETITTPAVNSKQSSITFNRTSSSAALRAGEQVTYSYDAAQKSVMRTDNSGAGPAVVVRDVNNITFERVKPEEIKIEVTIFGIETGNKSSEYTIQSQATARKLVTNYCSMTAPALEYDVLSFTAQKMGGLW